MLPQQVRLQSEMHGLDMTLPLLSSPPPRELEHSNEMSLRGKEGRTKARPTLTNARKSEALGSQGIEEAGEETARGYSPPRKDGDDDDTMLDESKPKATDFPPSSADSFFFTVPPLPKVKCDTSFVLLKPLEAMSRPCFDIPYWPRA